MTNTKSTPGPWKVKKGCPTLIMGPNPAGKKYPDWPVAQMAGHQFPTLEHNARLIAAAPFMLDTFEAMLMHIEKGKESPRVLLNLLGMMACNAIARAKGEKP